MIEVDVRGYSCPIPVVKTKKAIEENPGQALTVLVETATSKENVLRLAQSKGYSVKVEQVPDGYKLQINPSAK
jgi:tRNA 2-thiouridine synthesizing protein A